MNITKKIGIFTIALAALAAVLPQRSAASGSIRSITACDPAEGTRTYGEEDLLRIGDTMAFKVRLLNYNTSLTVTGGYNNPWEIKLRTGADATLAAQNLPKLGLWISGHRRFATLNTLLSKQSEDGYYTDFVFEYKAQAGDIALPVKFCNSTGKNELLADDRSAIAYDLENVGPSSYWEIKDANGNECQFNWGAVVLRSDSTDHYEYQPPGWSSPEETYDPDLSQAKIYIRTIDFDTVSTPVWRTIYENKITTADGNGYPKISVPGGADDDCTVYVWTEDSDVAVLAMGSEKVYHSFTPGETAGERTAKDYTVYTVNILKDDLESTFKVKGIFGAAGMTTTIYLSTTPTNIYNESGTLIHNFVTQTVAVVASPNPQVNLSINGDVKEIHADSDCYLSKMSFTVAVDPYTNDVKIALNPKVGTADLESGHIYVSADMDVDDFKAVPSVSEFTVPATASMDGEPREYVFYVYALGYSLDDPAFQDCKNGAKITFAPTISGDDGKFGDISTMSFKLIEDAPTITSPVSGDEEYPSFNVPYEISIELEDSWWAIDSKGSYTVEWYQDEDDSKPSLTSVVTVDKLDDDTQGELLLNVTYTKPGSRYSKIRVTGPDGKKAETTFAVDVPEPKRALLIPNGGDDVENAIDEAEEGQKLSNVRVKFENWKNEKSVVLYVFLEPLDEITSNRVAATGFITTAANPKGLAIPVSADISAKATKVIEFLDGGDDAYLSFNAVIRDKIGWNDASANTIDTFQVYTASGSEMIPVNNVDPYVSSVTVAGTASLGKDDSGESVTVNNGLEKSFTWTIGDVAADLNAAAPDQMSTTWTVKKGTMIKKQSTYKGNPADMTFTCLFNGAEGDVYDVAVAVTDKDGGSSTYTFKVVLAAACGTAYKFPDDESIYNGDSTKEIMESDLYGSNANWLKVSLSSPATEDLVLKVTHSGSNGRLKFENEDETGAVYVKIPAGYDVTSDGIYGRIYYADLDGNQYKDNSKASKFVITAAVTNTVESPDGVPYNQVYGTSQLTLWVRNSDPEVEVYPEDGVTNTVSQNESISIKWNTEDVPADIDNNLVNQFSGLKAGCWEYVSGSGTSQEGEVSFYFPYSGTYTVSMMVYDKDSGKSRMFKWYYVIKASKDVSLCPLGPSTAQRSDKSRDYQTAAGIGKGRVYSDDGEFTGAAAFRQAWSYSSTETKVNLFATGYEVGQVDNGALSAIDIALDKSGNNRSGYTITDFYTYNGIFDASDKNTYDSFFYAWVNITADEDGGNEVGTAYLAPQNGKGVISERAFTLPTEAEGEEDNPTYQTLTVDAVFSRELYAADNLGDINQDGVPDYFAAKKYDQGYLYALAAAEDGGDSGSSSDSEGGGITDDSDLKSVAGYNGDEDYLPAVFSNPNSTFSWAPDQEFNARREVRGFGIGLNVSQISDPEVTEAETLALECAFAAAKRNGKLNASAYADALSWMKDGYWSPERRTDPTMEDTDEDGIPDGYEYYIWYYATCGEVLKGKWNRLTGSKFNRSTIGQGEFIPSEVLANAFDPTKARKDSGEESVTVNGKTYTYDVKDFDGDGLSDIEEITLGTSPVSWDTDGDGVSDFFEVIMGSDPLDPVDGDRTYTGTDAKNNPDRDFMAWLETDPVYTVIAGHLADGTERLYAFKAAPTVEASEEDSSAWNYSAVSAEDGATYFFLGEPVTATDADGNVYLAVSTLARAGFESDGTAFIGATETVLPAGTLLEAAPAAVAEPVPFAKVTAGEEKPVRLFRYGAGANEKFVPAPLDGVTGEDIPEGFVPNAVLKEQSILYIHHQVFQVAGFDPRTAWNMDNYGYVASRWREQANGSAVLASVGLAGYAVNTAPFTTLDEFLLARYRYEVYSPFYDKKAGITDDERFEFRAKRYLEDDADVTTLSLFWGSRPDLFESGSSVGCTTIPVAQVDKTNLVNSVVTTFYGADSDADGIPDGWELYVNINPTYHIDATDMDLGRICEKDNTTQEGLTFLEEYAGTDSCNAYTNGVIVETIYSQHPGINTGWYNKFFPSNPYDMDTDGDGLLDNEEGKSWKAEFHVGRSSYRGTTHSFIYGENNGMPALDVDDGTSLCIRGGGLNPCTVDTDRDLLPDAWEYEFAGVVFNAGTCDAGLSDLDTTTICAADGLQTAYDDTTYVIRGGMDGTYYDDCNFDFDHDGLLNFQEYLVQSLRHLRYDDAETPLMGHALDNASWTPGKFVAFLPMQTFDGQDFYQRCQAAGFGGTSAFNYEQLGYFVLPKHEWEPMLMVDAGLLCCNYGDQMSGENCGYRYMFRPYGLSSDATPDAPKRINVRIGGYYANTVHMYATTDPRQWDSDGDGMDDYYELFHGLNPLLGSSADPSATDSYGEMNYVTYDRISLIYSGEIDAWNNGWTGWKKVVDFAADPTAMFDAIRFPWMMGTAEADADGDGLRNNEEALMVNVTSPSPTHTDPTPLWYTDSTSTNYASYVAQYYAADPYQETADVFYYLPWSWNANTILKQVAVDGVARKWKFAFEENEGFDTDGDGISDSREVVKTVTDLADPLDGSDPDHRQAMYFPGWNALRQRGSAVVSYAGGNRVAISTEYDMLRQFSIECWVKADSSEGEQVIVERVSNYGASTLSNNTSIVRANFRLGIRDGRFYGEYEGSAVDSGYARVTGSEVQTNVWTHLAMTYDGTTLTFYENGDPDFVDHALSSIQPANGVTVFRQEAGDLNFSVNEYGYTAVPSAMIIGAKGMNGNAISLSNESTWDSYSEYFKGYVDEVRVWDGARTSAEINADYKKTYTTAQLTAMREETYEAWAEGARRNDTLGTEELPAELIADYSFRNLPGAVRAGDVSQEPVGFTDGVINNARVDGAAVPGGIFCGWWATLPVRSAVYGNANIVPWVRNEVGHLPLLDGSAVDSQYWSTGFAGVQEAAISGVTSYSFPNTANPYPFYNYLYDRYWHYLRLAATVTRIDGTSSASSNTEYSASSYLSRYEYELRRGFVGVTDLVPLGDAFAQRSVTMWDGSGAADAWEYTGLDSDADGLPDWWEELYLGELSPNNADDWDIFVDYCGVKIPAWEAYRRDLAAGMLPTAKSKNDKLLAYRATTDADANGILDWWEKLYDVAGEAALDDNDNDGLSNFAEYLIGQCFSVTNYGVYAFPGTTGFPRVEPNQMRSYSDDGQRVPDYFLRVGKLYLGEMFADHDFMEDWWERKYDVLSAFRYDSNQDPDEDGWSNFAEARAATAPDRVSYLGVDELTIADYPIPTAVLTVNYRGALSVATTPVIIKAWHADDTDGVPDAIWNIAISGSTTQNASKGTTGSQSSTTSSGTKSTSKEKLVGMNPNTTVKLTLGPGAVVQGSVSVSFKDLAWYYTYVQEYSESGAEVVTSVIAGDASSATWVSCVIDQVRLGDTVTGDLIDNATLKVVGEVNYQTGALSIDLTKFQNVRRYAGTYLEGGLWCYTTLNLADSYVKVGWKSKMASQAFPRTFYLADSESPSATYNCRGHLREGKNLFVAIADLDGDGAYTPGEPYGVANGIDVGWNRTRPFSIELTDTSASIMRIDLASAVTANDFETQKQLNDRGINPSAKYPNVELENKGAELPSYLPRTRVKVVETGFNGIYYKKSGSTYLYPYNVLLDKYIDLSVNPMLTEKDLIASGELDLGYGLVSSGAARLGITFVTLTNAQYRVVIGEDSSSTNASALATVFVNAFEYGSTQSKTTPISPAGDITEIQPTFTWKHTNTIDKAYPGFILRVYTAAGQEIYNSGEQPAPARNTDGVYSWTAPIYANMMTPLGKIFSTTNNYYWQVSMIDAKFTTANSSETKCYFRVNTSGFGGGIADEGSLGATIKYFGPAGTSSTAVKKLVHLQAFTTPDFSGDPAGEAYLTNLVSLAKMDSVDYNCTIRGLKKGTYYLRAYIDTDGDSEWDSWESWGYACYVRTQNANMYTPKPITVDPSVATLPTAEIYIEDVDTDRDGLPDAWEVETLGSLDKRTSPTGNTYLTHVNPELKTSLSAYTSLDLYGGFGFGSVYPVLTMMSASGSTLTSIARLMNAAAAVTEPTVSVKSFSLTGGIEIDVSAATTVTDGINVYNTDVSEVTVKWTLKHKGSLAQADWDDVTSGTVTVPANGTSTVTVPASAYSDDVNDSSGFFTVTVELE